MNEQHQDPEENRKKGFSGIQVFGFVLGAMLIGIFTTAIVVKIILFPGPFKPVVLTEREEHHLETKLRSFGGAGYVKAEQKAEKGTGGGGLQPEKYSEEGKSREISFSERELNSMVAKNTNLAEQLAIDLSENMVSIKLLIPLDPDFPILGGKTLKFNAGAELAYRNERPVIKLRGVTIMGVPMPNAWQGGLKNIDLVQEFGADEGFWKTFSDGVDSISVEEGVLQVRLKE